MSADDLGRTWRHRSADNRRRYQAHRYAKAHTTVDLASVEFDRCRQVLRRLEKRNPAASEAGWEALTDLLARFADRYGR